MENPETLSLAERAYQRLRSEILYGDLMPGQRLRPADLQDKFQLGLTPIREALMRLSSENLVALDTHRGSRVSETSPAELSDLMATRRSIESLCLTSAMTHGDAAWEAEVVSAMHLLTKTPLPRSAKDREAATLWESRHRRFHSALVGACQEKWLLWFWNILADHSERYRKFRLLQRMPNKNNARDIEAEHHAIMQAVLARDLQKATELMSAHLTATEQSVAWGLQAPNPLSASTKGST
ncbi:MAG: FCD domain-containing protein [Betaproteobacteria bacterium]|nr:FCD domain-containing protein [Betaproteobacteria bacterium]NBY06183.1 FCD domain-containing protein [Betaproteobacteria bacterium]